MNIRITETKVDGRTISLKYEPEAALSESQSSDLLDLRSLFSRAQGSLDGMKRDWPKIDFGYINDCLDKASEILSKSNALNEGSEKHE